MKGPHIAGGNRSVGGPQIAGPENGGIPISLLHRFRGIASPGLAGECEDLRRSSVWHVAQACHSELSVRARLERDYHNFPVATVLIWLDTHTAVAFAARHSSV